MKLTKHQKPGMHICIGKNHPCYQQRWGMHKFSTGDRTMYLGPIIISLGVGRYAANGADYLFSKITAGTFFILV